MSGYAGLDDEDEFLKPSPPAPCEDNLPLRPPREVLLDHRQALPGWLTDHAPHFGRDTIDAFLSSRVVYYPASGTDGHPLELFGRSHSAHCFVHSDWGTAINEVRDQLETDGQLRVFGYRPLELHELTRAETSEIIFGGPEVRGALWAVLQREDGFDEGHGPARLAFLHIYADAIWVYHQLWERGHRAPYGVVLQYHGFAGNWCCFGGERSPLYQAASPHLPEWLFVAKNTNCWPGYCRASESEPGGMHNNQRFLCHRRGSE